MTWPLEVKLIKAVWPLPFEINPYNQKAKKLYWLQTELWCNLESISLIILRTHFFPHKYNLVNLKHIWEQGYQANCLKCSRLISFMLFSTEWLIENDSSYWSFAWINNIFSSISMNHTWRRKKKKKNCNRFFVHFFFLKKERKKDFFLKCHFLFWKKAYKTKSPGIKWNYANSNKSQTFKILCWGVTYGFNNMNSIIESYNLM